jgi:polyphosphate kinase
MDAHPYLSRELSWLAFNERVLAEATKPSLPLLERLKFLAISASNLDEFFIVRVGSLHLRLAAGDSTPDEGGLLPKQLLAQLRSRCLAFITSQYRILNQQLLPALAAHGIHRPDPRRLSPGQLAFLEAYFHDQLYPALSPIALDPDDASSLTIPALRLGIIAAIAPPAPPVPDTAAAPRHVILWLPTGFPRFINLPEEGTGVAHINIEELIRLFLPVFFPGETILSSAVFRISRNGDVPVDDAGSRDLASEMAEMLEQRKRTATVRLEIMEGADPSLTSPLRKLSGASDESTFFIPGELDLSSYFSLASLPNFEHLQERSWPPQPCPQIHEDEDIFAAIARQDILLYHPYQSFDTVLRLIESAAADPDVISIKQILYRTAKNSRIISALIHAAEAGKNVTVLVELKARFDEARNLERASELHSAGAQILYGVHGLKTHAKCTLVVRREAGRIRRYVHFGTGNYNEATAKLYTDISLLTCDPDYGADASAFFNAVTGLSLAPAFSKISMAPFTLRHRLLSLIEGERKRALEGAAAHIVLKMNSLQDKEMIDALYQASQAGVEIKVNCRGICCLRPGVPGLSENISVLSTIDRFLEHARIFYFHQGGDPQIFIASADWMSRNLRRRVELLVPVDEPEARDRLIAILEAHFKENVQGHVLSPDGTWAPVDPGKDKPFRSQEYFHQQALREAKDHEGHIGMLQPHHPS